MSDTDKPWAQLVSTTETDSDPVEIKKNKFIVGRSKAADLCLLGNKLVSGSHCFIERRENQSVWLQDTSTNGTLVNLTQKVIGKRVKLNHGDEVHVVYRKTEPSLNVAYMFQDMEQLRAEEEEDSSENTELYSFSQDLDTTGTAENSDPVERIDSISKRKVQDLSMSTDENGPLCKRPKPSGEVSRGPEERLSHPGGSCTTGDVTETKPSIDSPRASDTVAETHAETTDTGSVEKNANKNDEVDAKKDSANQKTDIATAGGESSNQKTDEEKVGESSTNKKADEAKAGESSTNQKADEAKAGESSTNQKPVEDDVFEDTLVCIICQEILHDCISCQPCMHSFCAGCFSDWMLRSEECPSCRGKVERVNKNYIVNNLVEAYLKLHPEKKRPEDELKALDDRSKILKDSVKPPKPKKTLSERIDEDEDEDEGSLSSSSQEPDSSGDGGIAPPPFATTGIFTGFGTVNHFRPMTRPPRTVCRQCPGYTAPVVGMVTGTIGAATSVVTNIAGKVVNLIKGQAGVSTNTGACGSGEGTSTGGSGSTVTAPTPPPYRCRPTQVHFLCQCCLQPMPDRRVDAANDANVPKQQCPLCFRLYCHLYWGCTRPNCNGCFNKFKDLRFSRESLNTVVLDNQYESTVLRNYVESRGQTMEAFLQECLTKLDAGTYTCTDQLRGVKSDTALCYTCGLKNLRDLAYQYRKAIPRDQLPAAVTARQDCYWGKNCRTQRGKPHHAANFNHVCEQTR